MEGFQNFHFNEAWDLQIPSLEMGRLGGPVGEDQGGCVRQGLPAAAPGGPGPAGRDGAPPQGGPSDPALDSICGGIDTAQCCMA